MRLEEIGFYTLCDNRPKNVSINTPLWRCELLLTDKCNFKCPYCRDMRNDCKGTLEYGFSKNVISLWCDDNLQNIRFSGGEPSIYSHLPKLINYSQKRGIKHIAVSTNGYSGLDYYKMLIDIGVNDFSISLDACCSSMGKKMTGGIDGAWEIVVKNIYELAKLTYVTTGMVFDEQNTNQAIESIKFAHNLGVSDIRIISSSQYNGVISGLDSLDKSILDVHPILKYRINNFKAGRNVRGIGANDYNKCALVLDDMAIAGNYHFPCIIYLREQGDPIGRFGVDMRKEREKWFLYHDTKKDPICKKNCLDVCVDYNNKYREFRDNSSEKK